MRDGEGGTRWVRATTRPREDAMSAGDSGDESTALVGTHPPPAADGYGAVGQSGVGEEEEDSPSGVPVVVRLRLLYFLNCFAMSISTPFFVLYTRDEIGLSAGKVGLIAALQIVGGYAVGPAVSLLVDRFRIHKPVWIFSILMGIVPVQLITVTNSFESALAVGLSIAVLNAPNSILLDSSTLRFLGNRSSEYGKIRLWGAIGWGLGSLVAGSVVQVFGDRVAFGMCGVLMLATAAVVLSLDFSGLDEDGAEEEDEDDEGGLPLFQIKLLIPSLKYAIFLMVAVVAG